MPKIVTDQNFKNDILDHKGVSFVDFWAGWCGPCRMIAPAIEGLAKDFDGKAQVAKLDIDANQRIAAQYEILSIPTMIIFKDGQEVDRLVGVMPKEALAQRLDKWIA